MDELYLVAARMVLQFFFEEKKGGGRLRLCINYRSLNANTITNSWPLPQINELLARLKGARYFSKLDLRDGYH